MTPGERLVVAAAERWYQAVANDGERADQALIEAVEALRAERDGPAMEIMERDLTYGQVVEGDEIYSPKTGRWYPVVNSITGTDGKVRVGVKGIAKRIIKTPADPVRVRRGETGTVVDMFASVAWSTQTRPTLTPGAGGLPALLTDPDADTDTPDEDEDEN